MWSIHNYVIHDVFLIINTILCNVIDLVEHLDLVSNNVAGLNCAEQGFDKTFPFLSPHHWHYVC